MTRTDPGHREADHAAALPHSSAASGRGGRCPGFVPVVPGTPVPARRRVGRVCGRYASSRRPEDLVEEFEIVEDRTPAPLPADYNVAPTKEVYAVLERPPRPHGTDDAGEGSAAAERQLRVLRWGLVPSWAKDPAIGNRMINARMETVAEKPSYRRAFAKRRCLLPADGYYEWYPTEQLTRSGKPRKQPFFIRPRDHGTLAMAGLYEIWRDPALAEDDPARFRWTCTVITTAAEDSLGHIHDRMPLMVERERWDQWLAPTSEQDSLLALLVPASPGNLEAYPVAGLVSNVRNNGPELLEPLPLDDPPPDDASGLDEAQPLDGL
jgi:putative SOS response-associated peptidase YedK